MTAELIFALASWSVVPAWLLLLCAPRWRWTHRLVHGAWIPALLCGGYVLVLLVSPHPPEGSTLMTLQGVLILFGSPWGAATVWLHSLAFDLFVGAWIVRDASRLQISRVWVVASLLATFTYGPAGLLLYLLVRFAGRRVVSLDERASPEAMGGNLARN